MSINQSRRVAVALVLASLAIVCQARAQAIDPAIYIIFDTSGSMLWDVSGTNCWGDGSLEHPHNGNCKSRMFIAKNAVSNVVNAYTEVRWGLARFKQIEGLQQQCLCTDQTDVASSEEPDECDVTGFTDHSYDLPGISDRVCINYEGAGYYAPTTPPTPAPCPSRCCGISDSSVDMFAADILVALDDFNEDAILLWMDHKETAFTTGKNPTTGNHCWTGSSYGDCELRGIFRTQLAGSLRSIYTRLSTVDLGGDPNIGCRPYKVILLTDGDETCGGNPAQEATTLRSTPDLTSSCTNNDQCPQDSWCSGGYCRYDVQTHVIAFAMTSTTGADAIAAAGGTGTAIPATSEAEIGAAMADIISESVLFELCNGQDDNCDGEIDEGYPVGQACDNGGQGVCFTSGTWECDPADQTRVRCNYSTTPIQPGTQPETCDGLDNDCDGEVDEGGVCTCHGPELCNGADDYCDSWASHAEGSEDSRVGQPCGTDVGACDAGVTHCGPGGSITCSDTGPELEICDADLPENDQNCNGVNNDGVPPRECTKTNSFGTCLGLEICNVDGNWTCWAPTPAAEACNNVDDDCNGQIDENVFRACQISNAFGTCHGTQACSAGTWSACSASTPALEICNDQDDNCNGQVDENLSQPCHVTNLHGTCSGLELCVGGSYTGCTAKTPAAEICNNLDDDCDGQVDAISRTCYTGPEGTLGKGICQAGLQTCTAGTWSGCVGERVPQAEVCDGVDNDCDGQTDEDLGTTTCGVGICQNTVQNCILGVPQVCNPFLGAQPEVCDNVDNDCDGVVDGITEACYPFASGCAQTSPGVWSCDGACRTGLRTCPIGGGGWGACSNASGPATEVCDGIDNDCDGQTDEDALGNPISLVCYSPGSGNGCTQDGSAWTCQGPCHTGLRLCQNGVLGACQNEQVPSLEVCDGVDNDCDGQVDEPEDIPNLGQACGTALGRCTPGVWVCDGGNLDCVGGDGPFEGRCNGEDDDCDGQIDEADELAEDLRVDQPCGDATGLCEPGATQCLGGLILCVGGTGPTEEVCDGGDNDCDDEVDEQVDCPPVGNIDTHCVLGACRPECTGSEFPCPGTLQCEQHLVDGVEVNVCMPREDPCGGACPPGWNCVDGECVDPCDPDPCEWWQTCNEGACLDTSCSGPGGSCPGGQFCWEHACQPDPCLTANCDAMNGFCVRDCTSSDCSASCEPLCDCPLSERCLPHGGCAPNSCPDGCDAGQRCDEQTGRCEPDPCFGVSCDYGSRCFEGDCIEDPCRMVTCPVFYLCELLPVPDGQGGVEALPVCHADPRWWVEGSGVEDHTYTARGRGGCQAAGPDSPPGLVLLLMSLVLLLRSARRRKGGVR